MIVKTIPPAVAADVMAARAHPIRFIRLGRFVLCWETMSLRRLRKRNAAAPAPYTWEYCRSCGGAGWVGSRIDHRHPDCGHRCILCDPPPGYDRTHAVDVAEPSTVPDHLPDNDESRGHGSVR